MFKVHINRHFWSINEVNVNVIIFNFKFKDTYKYWDLVFMQIFFMKLIDKSQVSKILHNKSVYYCLLVILNINVN